MGTDRLGQFDLFPKNKDRINDFVHDIVDETITAPDFLTICIDLADWFGYKKLTQPIENWSEYSSLLITIYTHMVAT